jgi:hypothetical protein
VVEDMETLLFEVMESSETSLSVQNLWQSLVVPLFPALTITNIRAWFGSDVPLLRGARGDRLVAIFILCRLGFSEWNIEINVAIGGGGISVQTCTATDIDFCAAAHADPDAMLEKRAGPRDYAWSTVLGRTTYGRTSRSQPVSPTMLHPLLLPRH